MQSVPPSLAGNRHSLAPRSQMPIGASMPDAKVDRMATRAELHRLVDELPDRQVSMARIVVEDSPAEPEHEGRPYGMVDEWGDLSSMTDAAAAEMMQRLDKEERVVGHEPWRP
jgi:hypothetical protein